MAPSEEDEWEYEYDDTETETFYIPIDLANVPSVQGAVGSNTGSTQKGHPTLLKTKLRAINTERREAESNLAVQNVDATESIGKMQIIGLHTENPLIMYNDQLLSCEWNRTIGTDLIFAKPKSGGNEDGPLRSLPSVDLLATGSAKLVARVARMRPKDELFQTDSKVNEQAPAEAMEISEENAPAAAAATAATEGVGEGESATTTQILPTRPAPSSFLGRLNAVKARLGEESQLALSTTPGGSRLVTVEEGAPDPGGDTAMGGT